MVFLFFVQKIFLMFLIAAFDSSDNLCIAWERADTVKGGGDLQSPSVEMGCFFKIAC